MGLELELEMEYYVTYMQHMLYGTSSRIGMARARQGKVYLWLVESFVAI